MVDLHLHILPGLDDGAEDLETAVRMAKMAAHSGVFHVCRCWASATECS